MTGLQTHISHRLLGPSTHAHTHTHTKRLKPNDPGSPSLLFPSLWLLTSSFLVDKRLLAPLSTVLTSARTHTCMHAQHPQPDRMGCLFCFLRRLGKEGREGWDKKGAGERGVLEPGSRRLSDACASFKKVEQIIHECSGRSIAKSPLNYKGVRYNGDGMLLGRLNVVNTGLLSAAAEDASRGGGWREKSRRATSLHYCRGGKVCIQRAYIQEVFSAPERRQDNNGSRENR